jgi:hypothetical protein
MIEIKPSSIVIHDYEMGQCRDLEKSLSIWNPVRFEVEWSAYMYLEDKKALIIPGSYDLDTLRNYFPRKEMFQVKDFFPSDKVTFGVNGKVRDQIQKNSLNFLSGETAYFGYTKSKSQKRLSLGTGGGKTFVTISYLSLAQKRSIIMVDNNDMLGQWKDELLRHTSLKEDEIGLISGSSSIEKIMKDKKKTKYKVLIASHRTLASYGKDDVTKIRKFFKKIRVGIKVYDEAHVEWKNIFMIDSVTDVEKTIYLTATPGRSNAHEDKVYQNMFSSIVSYGEQYKYREESNYHKVGLIEFNSKPDIGVQSRLSSRFGFNVNAWCEYIVEDCYDEFIDLIFRTVDMSHEFKCRKIAIVVHTLEMASKVIDDIKERYGGKYSVGNFTGLVKDKKEKELQKEKDIIITTDKSFDKGVNIMDLEVLINTVPLSSAVKIEQMLGRLRYVKGKKCVFFDMTDVGFKECVRQRKSRRKVYNLKAKSIFDVKI